MRKTIFVNTLLAFAILCAASGARGQSATAPERSAADTTSSANQGAPLVFWNRQITVFRSYVNQLSPTERAAKAGERLANLPADAYEWKIAATETTVGQYTGLLISVNDQYVFGILPGDLDSDSNETLQAAADRSIAQLRAALEARAQQRSVSRLVRSIGLSIAATLLLAFALWLSYAQHGD